jgi:hypothetical protein
MRRDIEFDPHKYLINLPGDIPPLHPNHLIPTEKLLYFYNISAQLIPNLARAPPKIEKRETTETNEDPAGCQPCNLACA